MAESAFVPVGRVEDFEDGAIYVFEVGGQRVAVVQWRGRFYAFSDECTHWGVSLTTGWINGAGRVVCPYHESAFDLRSGAIADGPAYDDLRIYEVRVDDGDVLVGTGG